MKKTDKQILKELNDLSLEEFTEVFDSLYIIAEQYEKFEKEVEKKATIKPAEIKLLN